MVMLSDLTGRTVLDDAGRRGKLVDLAVDLSDDEHPAVTLLIVRQGNANRLVPAEQVTSWERPIRVTDIEEARPCSDDLLAECDLARRDVLDTLIVDVGRERTVRVNDVWLRPEEDAQSSAPGSDTPGSDRLVVAGVDVGPCAILHRISHGLLFRCGDGHIVKWSDVEVLRGDPRRTGDRQDVRSKVARLQPARIADLAEALPYLHAAELLACLDVSQAADVLEMLAPERQIQVIDELDDERVVAILAEVAPDHVSDILGRLPFETARHLLEQFPRRQAKMVADLLQYPPGTAGGIMTNDVVIVSRDLDVAEAIERIRPRLASPDLVYYVYVVEDLDSHRLSGIVTLRDLLLATPDQPVDEVMNEALVTANPLEAATAVAYRLADYQLNALPVIDDDRRLLGVVTIDKAISQIAPETLRQDLPRVFA